MDCILIGFGEIGKSVKGFYGRYHDIDVYDILKVKQKQYKEKYDLMLVAFPYNEDLDFAEIVNGYKNKFNVDNVLIFSTVAIGTTSKIENAVHSPVEGKHPNLEESLSKWQVFLGGKSDIATKFFVSANKMVRQLDKPEHTEFIKLQSTTNYGIQIEYARYLGNVCDDIGLDYDEIVAYNMSYNNLYKSMGNPTLSRQILTPPSGKIGGHCVVPNAVILNKQYPNILVNEIVEVNK